MTDMPHLPVDAMKDSSGNADDVAELEGGLDVSVATSDVLALAGRCMATGAILALDKTMPHLCLGDRDGDMVAQRQLFASYRASTVDSPSRIKPTMR